jgi:hypothetical protein
MKNKNTLITVAVLLAASSVLEGRPAAPDKITAQKVAEEVAAAHPEITGLEIAATKSESEGCKTIAATEAQEVGQKCDKDELTAAKTNAPFVEKEKDGFDVTLPLHDSLGKVMGTAGMDFKPEPGQKKSDVVNKAKQIASELEKRLTSKEQLFEPAK